MTSYCDERDSCIQRFGYWCILPVGHEGEHSYSPKRGGSEVRDQCLAHWNNVQCKLTKDHVQFHETPAGFRWPLDEVFKKKGDEVNHPSHYTFGKYEVIDVLDDWFETLPYEWQVAKYLARAAHKGNQLQDLKKAQFYLNRRIEQLSS